MIIGLTGPNAGGKGEVAKYLQIKGYTVYSLSDVLREEAKKTGLDESRKTLINFGYQLRKKYGESILVKKISRKIRQKKNIVVDSIRNPGEIKKLREIGKKEKVFILAVDAAEKLRYQRLRERKRLGDLKNFREFIAAEKKENSNRKFAQQIGECMKLADRIIINDGSLKQLQQKVDTVLKELKTNNAITQQRNNGKRPSWDEYFLKLALLVAERSTCRRHHVGAVIVRDKRVLTTGYNGAPSGVKDCLELGCLRNQLGIPSGTRQEVCRAIHAEQNAIIQAGLYGMKIEGATIYCTHTPCILCAKMIVNAKIKKYVTCGIYADENFRKLFRETKIKFLRMQTSALKIEVLK